MFVQVQNEVGQPQVVLVRVVVSQGLHHVSRKVETAKYLYRGLTRRLLLSRPLDTPVLGDTMSPKIRGTELNIRWRWPVKASRSENSHLHA